MLDARRMRVLREVAARGSFSAAAEALSFTQSAVSQHVAALEREAGTQLVERRRSGVRLTEAGRMLVGHADAILARIECAEDDLAALAGLRGGRLRLISFQSGGSTLAPRAVAAFHERHPQVELSMLEAEPDEAGARLKSGEVDLALVYDHEPAPAFPVRPGRRALRRVDLGVRLPADHRDRLPRGRLRAEGRLRGGRDHGSAGAGRGRRRRHAPPPAGPHDAPPRRGGAAPERPARQADLGGAPRGRLRLTGERRDAADARGRGRGVPRGAPRARGWLVEL